VKEETLDVPKALALSLSGVIGGLSASTPPVVTAAAVRLNAASAVSAIVSFAFLLLSLVGVCVQGKSGKVYRID
jgi:hypothetical protein